MVLVIILAGGCGKSEEAPTIQFMRNQGSSRYSQFYKLPVVAQEPDPDGVSFRGIGFAADGDYIMVRFAAPQSQSQLWQQDYIYVVDEGTRGVYKDIPVAPVVGPLIGRPAQDGQIGYVMLFNYYKGIKNGSKVSVVLGNYKREHIVVE